ncbi:MAG: cobalamin-dependent protein [Bdellovibrionales bacterium]|nr:cobalamin-dependent protein [Bdellovibrionales bacterium]
MNQPGPKQVNLKKLKPYGDIMDDGTIQICFTLPVEPSPEAKEAAIRFCEKMGLDQIKVATMEKAADGFALFVIYANLRVTVDFTEIKVVKIESKKRSREEIDEIIKEKIGRKLVVLGACTGYDAHTVGIDAIMNMKGFAGDYGLERYQWLDARNLGAQVLNEDLLQLALREKADAVLISKVVTQHNIHVKDLKDFVRRADQLGVKDRLILVAGGPRVTHPMALECGFDAGFGVGTKPSDVASYIVEEFLKRRDQQAAETGEKKVSQVSLKAKAKRKNAKKPKAKAKTSAKKRK